MLPGTARTLLLLLCIVASLAVLLGAFVKVQQWPGANYLLGAGMAMEIMCAIGFAILSWKNRNKSV